MAVWFRPGRSGTSSRVRTLSPYPVAGTLWQATATDVAIQGSVQPVISNLNARARSGQTYRVLFGVATPQGVNPAVLSPGQQTTGVIYFDVTGDAPDSVVYNSGASDLAVWVQPPPPAPSHSAASGSTASGSVSSPAPAAAPTPTSASVPAAAATPAAAPFRSAPAPRWLLVAPRCPLCPAAPAPPSPPARLA